MKYLLGFNEGVEMNNKMWRRTTLAHYYGHEIQNFNMRDLEELSMYFNNNQPSIYYGLDYNKINKELSNFPEAINDHTRRLFNGENSFAFFYKLFGKAPTGTYRLSDTALGGEGGSSIVSNTIYDKLLVITKNTDDYFLVLEKSHSLIDTIDTYICDDLEGLIEFLDSYFSDKHLLSQSDDNEKETLYIENEL